MDSEELGQDLVDQVGDLVDPVGLLADASIIRAKLCLKNKNDHI